VWGLLAPFTVALIYFSLVPIFRRVVRKEVQPLPVAEVNAA